MLVLGIFVGVLPGLGGPKGVAILLPLTFTMDPTSAIVMLSCIYWWRAVRRRHHLNPVQHSRRSLVGRDHLRRLSDGAAGRAAEALTAAFTSSFIGSLVAVLLITFLAPMISSFALKFGPPEILFGVSAHLLLLCRPRPRPRPRSQAQDSHFYVARSVARRPSPWTRCLASFA